MTREYPYKCGEREEILYIRNDEVKEYKDGKTLRREKRKAQRQRKK